MTLIRHIRDDFIFILRTLQSARLPDVMRQRLLRADMQATLHRRQRRHEVCMIWSIDHHTINFLTHLIEHHSEILEVWNILADLWIFFTVWLLACINIAQRDDVLVLATIERHASNTADTDHRDVHLAIRRWAGLTDTEAGQYKSGRTGYRCFLNKISTFHEVI